MIKLFDLHSSHWQAKPDMSHSTKGSTVQKIQVFYLTCHWVTSAGTNEVPSLILYLDFSYYICGLCGTTVSCWSGFDRDDDAQNKWSQTKMCIKNNTFYKIKYLLRWMIILYIRACLDCYYINTTYLLIEEDICNYGVGNVERALV